MQGSRSRPRQERLEALVAELGADNVATRQWTSACLPAARWCGRYDNLGRVDCVVLNAGIGMYGGILDRSDDD